MDKQDKDSWHSLRGNTATGIVCCGALVLQCSLAFRRLLLNWLVFVVLHSSVRLPIGALCVQDWGGSRLLSWRVELYASQTEDLRLQSRDAELQSWNLGSRLSSRDSREALLNRWFYVCHLGEPLPEITADFAQLEAGDLGRCPLQACPPRQVTFCELSKSRVPDDDGSVEWTRAAEDTVAYLRTIQTRQLSTATLPNLL